ncbi:MAG: phosphatase PAP2 family protein [Novosphingobium sp.]
MTKTMTIGLSGALLLTASAAAVLAQQPAAPPAMPSSMSAAGRMISTPGYLPKGAVPDSLLLNPAPPASGSPAEARDVAAAEAAAALRGTPRWALATQDADLSATTVGTTFSCAAGFRIDAASTPKLNALLLRAAADLGRSTAPTKRKYMRPRPFMVNGRQSCTPDAEGVLRSDGSYPSGHSALGWGWSLILAEAVPDRAAQIVARGRSFGDSRRICNVHWLSDIEEGRVVASAVVARLNAEPEFQADLAAARAEAAAAAGKEPAGDCAAEAALLAL